VAEALWNGDVHPDSICIHRIFTQEILRKSLES
jgi:hypothetical protein